MMTEANDDGSAETLILLTSDIVAAHVSNNPVAVDDVAKLIGQVHAALASLGAPAPEQAPRPEPAVSVRSSVKPDHIICLEDGKKLKMLKRHLMTDHNMTIEEYRQRWDLPASYPMVAPAYAEKRRELAKKIGLGRKRGAAALAPAPRPAPVKAAAPKTAAKKSANGKAAPAKAAPKARTTTRKNAATSNDQA